MGGVGRGSGQREKQGDEFGSNCNNPGTRGWSLSQLEVSELGVVKNDVILNLS